MQLVKIFYARPILFLKTYRILFRNNDKEKFEIYLKS